MYITATVGYSVSVILEERSGARTESAVLLYAVLLEYQYVLCDAVKHSVLCVFALF